jgi:mono/diheme cytochrome c family protein
MNGIPRWIFLVTLILVALSWIPFAFIARARNTKHSYTRIQIIPDMDQQPKFKAQSQNTLFADTRAARPLVSETVAQSSGATDARTRTGMKNGQSVVLIPIPVTGALMRRGQERYEIYCAPCHGLAGGGDGIVARRADALQEGTWTPPSSLHDPVVRARPDVSIFNLITNGIRNMPAYGAQIHETDRWAIVVYVRALQRSQNAGINDVPPDMRPLLR